MLASSRSGKPATPSRPESDRRENRPDVVELDPVDDPERHEATRSTGEGRAPQGPRATPSSTPAGDVVDPVERPARRAIADVLREEIEAVKPKKNPTKKRKR